MRNLRYLLIALAIASASLFAAEPTYPITPNEAADLKNLGSGVNSPEADYTPFIMPDEKFLFFQTNRAPSVGPEGTFDLWYSINKNRDVPGAEPLFETAGNIGLPVNTEDFDGHPSLRKLPSGEFEMYFTSMPSAARPGPALTNIYHALWHEGKWTTPVPVTEINSDFHDRMPSISQDGKYLFFSSDRPGGHGGDDIWFSEWNNETQKWGAPKNAGSINTAHSEVTPSIHADGITLYFSSNHPGGVGGTDIYFSQSLARLAREDAPDIAAEGWSKPLNLGKPFNSQFDDEYPTVIASGERVYFASDRPEGHGSYDIYRARVPLFARPTQRLSYKGRTFTGKNKRPVDAKLEFVSGEIRYQAETTVGKNGAYEFKVINQKEYKVEAEATGYRKISETLDTRPIHESTVIEKDFAFVRDIKLPKTVSLAIEFTGPDGKPVTPKVKYRLVPKDRKLETLKVKNGAATLQILNTADYKSEEAAITELDGFVLEVQAKKKGLGEISEKREIFQLLEDIKGEVPEVLKMRFAFGEQAIAAQPKEEPKAEPKEEPKEEPAVEVKEETPAKEPGEFALKLVGRVYFASDVKDKFVGDGEAVIKKIYNRWRRNRRARIYIYGHGDSTGEAGYNRRLSKERAQFVKKQLIDMGVPAKKIIAKGLGNRRRLVKHDNSAAKRSKNRRAEVYMFGKAAAKKEPAEVVTEPGAKPAEPVAEEKPAAEVKPAPAEQPAAVPAEPATAPGEAAPATAPGDK